MALEIVGAGFGRTGTLSLKMALETLGFEKCYHMMEVTQSPGHHELWLAAWRGKDVWDRIFDGYRAAVDWPAAAFWPELMERYPDAKVLLSVRDAESWYRSASATIFQRMMGTGEEEPPETRERLLMARTIIRDGTFGGDLYDRENAIRTYEENVARVRAVVPGERLIEFEANEGWEGLCRPLGVPVPDSPYPKVNTTEEFQERWRERRRQAPTGGGVVPAARDDTT